MSYEIRTKLKGVSFSNEDGKSRQELIQSLERNDKLEIVHEPNNKYDKNCHSVIFNGNVLGNISKELSEDLMKKKSEGEKIICIKEWKVTGTEKITKGLNVCIEMEK